MDLVTILIEWFALDVEFVNFAEFIPWFCKLLLAVYLVSFTLKCMFDATWKIHKSLK